ncbi:MAG: ATP-binding protein [Planctomycetota bacterium]
MDVHSLPPFATTFVEASVEPALVLDESGLVVLWNARAARLFGRTELGGPPERTLELVSSESRNEWRRFLGAAEPALVSMRHVNEDGSSLALTLVATVVNGGKVRCVLAVVQPTGGGKFADTGSPLERALASMRDYLLLLDGAGRIRFANQAIVDGLGYGNAQLLGKPWSQLLARSSHPALLEQVRRATLDQGRYSSEICFAAADGREVWLRLSASRMDGPGAPNGLVVVLTDITRGRAEEKLRGEFAANVSHELRTPLASIKGFTSTILNDATMPPDTKREFLQIIESEADRLSLLIDDLLDYSRLESGHFEMHFKTVDFNDVLDRVLSILKPQIENKNIRLNAARPTESAPLLGDSARLIQILQNIVGNAIKYTPAGGAVNVQLSEDEQQLVCTVRDTGIGIAEEDIPHVFTKFYRSREAKQHCVGTGLGLSIAKGLVEQHGGSIEIASERGRGTTVTIRLPREGAAPQHTLTPQGSVTGQ